ncbi:MAG: hypothetical protein BAJALOKI2v1_100074 [Promethearchaeota archaeon]|nr:MAG: hypothetical protein BAJALOKI2v1_100074 [Candidatus Lokiarchaeota archaeon]
MLAKKRRDLILEKINKFGSVTVNKLEEEFNISRMTAWRDLKILEEQNLITKVYGGAVKKKSTEFRPEPKFEEKLITASKEKDLIARFAAENLVKDSDVIILEGSSTVMYMIQYLKERKNLTILTNGVETLVKSVKQLPHIEIHGSGGMVRKESLTFVGPKAKNFFHQYKADKIFLSGTGFTLEDGVSDPSLLDMQVKKLMCSIASEIIVLMDSSKFNKCSLASTVNLDEIDLLITDFNVSRDYVDEIKALGLDVVIAEE